MICEACGGDGQIEVGAYRGDDGTATRTCTLCGGVAQSEPFEQPTRSRRSNAAHALSIAKARAEALRQERLASPVTLANSNQMTGEQIAAELERRGLA